MARQPSRRGSAEESEASLEELDSAADAYDEDDADVDDESVDDAEDRRSAQTDEFWAEVRVAPVEIALPKGVGFTLRAYRLSTEVAEPEIDDTEDDEFAVLHHTEPLDDEDAPPEIDEEELTQLALAAGPRPGRRGVDEDLDDDLDDELDDDSEDGAGRRRSARDRTDDEADSDVEAQHDDEEEADDDEPDGDAAAEEEDAVEPEEVPVFLARRGRLLLFSSAEGLVEYVRTTDDHDLVQLDSWADVRERIEVADIMPLDEDRYELDLVVENLRGGHDAWNPVLIIQAGELARDVGHALRLQAVVDALSSGSPLDDLDEGLRGVEAGGLGGFFARRRVRKIDPQTTAALGWRTIIGKISALVDWRN